MLQQMFNEVCPSNRLPHVIFSAHCHPLLSPFTRAAGVFLVHMYYLRARVLCSTNARTHEDMLLSPIGCLPK
jgi:hypothetical protein